MQPYRPRRVDVNVDAVLKTAEGHIFKALVLDLSAKGFRVELDDHLIVGERVSLKVGSKEAAEAEIKWTLGRQAGGQFLGAVPVPT